MSKLLIERELFEINNLISPEIKRYGEEIFLFDISINQEVIIEQFKIEENNFIKTDLNFKNIKKIKDILFLFKGDSFKVKKIKNIIFDKKIVKNKKACYNFSIFWGNIMDIEEIENIIKDENIIEKELNQHYNLIKKINTVKSKFNKLILYSVFLEMLILPIIIFFYSSFLFNFHILMPLLMSIIYIGGYIEIGLEKEETFLGYFLKSRVKKKMKKLGINENDKLFNFLKKFNLNNETIEEVNEYYNNLKSKRSKELFFEKYGYSDYLYTKILKYIKENNIEELKTNKHKLSKLISKSVFENYCIEEISNLLQEKLKKERSVRKNQILNIFKEDEEILEKEKKNYKKAIVEI